MDHRITKFVLKSKIIRVIYWCVVVILIGLILSACDPKTTQNQQLVQSYQYVLPTVVTIRGDRINYWDSEIRGVGTGFFISKEYVLTAAHVVNLISRNAVELQLWNGQIIPAKKIAINETYDLALLQIDPNYIKCYKIPKLNLEINPQIGEMVFIVGSPYLFDGTMTKGIFSRGASISNDFRWLWDCKIYLADAFVEGGNSGSPVFNARLKVIGIVSGYYGKFAVIIPSYNISCFLEDTKFYNGY